MIWRKVKNAGGVLLGTYTVVQVHAPNSWGAGHRDYVLDLLFQEADRLQLRMRVVEEGDKP